LKFTSAADGKPAMKEIILKVCVTHKYSCTNKRNISKDTRFYRNPIELNGKRMIQRLNIAKNDVVTPAPVTRLAVIPRWCDATVGRRIITPHQLQRETYVH
jgi:hypothetical protein